SFVKETLRHCAGVNDSCVLHLAAAPPFPSAPAVLVQRLVLEIGQRDREVVTGLDRAAATVADDVMRNASELAGDDGRLRADPGQILGIALGFGLGEHHDSPLSAASAFAYFRVRRSRVGSSNSASRAGSALSAMSASF